MAVSETVAAILAGLAVTGALGVLVTREVAKSVLLLVLVLTSISALLYEAWGLGLAAAYFMLSVGGLSILVLLAASIVEPAEEPKASLSEYLGAAIPSLVLGWLVYASVSDKSSFSSPVFFDTRESVVAGLVILVSLLAGLYLLREVRKE